MKIDVNDRIYEVDATKHMFLSEFLRDISMLSVKRGCETTTCGLCTVLVDNKAVLSCSYPLGRAEGKKIYTLEGLQKEAMEFGEFVANEGVEQCGFCSPGFVISVLAMKKELKNPTEDDILQYLGGTMCRCSGYQGQLRAIKKYIEAGRW